MSDKIYAILDLIKRNTICKARGHNLAYAGSCPYTGATYDYCEACHHMVPREEVYD